MVAQLLKRAGTNDNVWSADAATGLYTRGFGIVDSGSLSITLGASANDLNPAGLSEAYYLLINPTSSGFYLGGIAGGVHGRRYKLVNVSSSNTFDIFNQALGSANNQFATPRGFPLNIKPRQSFEVYYNGAGGFNKWLVDWWGTVTTTFPNVGIPGYATGERGSISLSLAGSALAGVTVGDSVVVCPAEDLAADGAGNGGILEWRMTALETLKITFIGAIAGGVYDIQVSHSM